MNVFSFSTPAKRRNNANNATNYVKLDKKRRESSIGNHYITSPRVIIKAIIMMMIAFITFKSSLVPLFEGL